MPFHAILKTENLLKNGQKWISLTTSLEIHVHCYSNIQYIELKAKVPSLTLTTKERILILLQEVPAQIR